MKQTIVLAISLFVFLISYGQRKEAPYNLIEKLNISYVEKDKVEVDSLQQLNLVLPKGKIDVPLFIWIGGGAWALVNRHKEMDIARNLAKKGIAVASIGHRLSPALWYDASLDKGVEHPKHIEDVAMAVKFLYENAAEYGYSKEQLFIGGYSSGAQLSALLCLDETYLNNVGLSQEILKGVIPISGTYDIIKYYNGFLESNQPDVAELHVKGVFGKTMEQLSQASPINYIDKDEIPLLIIADSEATDYTKTFEEALLEKEYTAFQIVYDYSRTHKTLWQTLSNNKEPIYLNMMIDFIENNSSLLN